MTLKEHWDDPVYIGDPSSDRPWERITILKGRVVVQVKGMVFCPHRVTCNGKVFRLDTVLRDGRTLRLLLPPDYPCALVPETEANRPLPPVDAAEVLGFPPRDHSRAVTDADRITFDLFTRNSI